MKTKEEKIALLKEVFEDMSDGEFVCLYNDNYVDGNRYEDDRIFYMDEWDDMVSNMTPRELLDEFQHNSDFDLGDDYFTIGVYGYSSFSDPIDSDRVDNMVDYVLRHSDDLGIDEIAEILNDEEDEDTEEE